VLLANTQVLFDDQPVTPAFAYVPAAALPADAAAAQPGASASASATANATANATAGAPTATVRLTGAVPAGAARFRFSYGLVLGSYVLT